ncbi:unnamed protein product [Blepharisma stoltei]|uniref:RRM domain-containing protein n=1 Tax=Blepharisma stoltei TaxID=1481888 RepID=A0AAU9ID38_9CILI|nr:unnamed protein product [Blepharisma stoltei]
MARSHSNSPDKEIEGASLYITNLSYSAKEEDLQKTFEDYGKIVDFKIIKDPISNKSRGFGFVTYENPEDADKAKNELNNSNVGGRELRVEKARRNKAYGPTPGKYMGNDKYRRSPRRDRDYRDRDRDFRNRSRDRDYRDRDRDRDYRDYRDRSRERDSYRSREYRDRDSRRDRRGSRSPRRKSRSPQSRSTFT